MNLRYAQRVYRGFEWLGGELGTGSRINHGGILHTVRRAKRAKPDFIAILPLGDLVYR